MAYRNQDMQYNRGVSVKTLLHFSQCYRVNRFQKWTDDFKMLLEKDIIPITEEIPLSRISVPTALFVADHDTLATIDDARWTQEQIGESVVHF